MFIFGKGVKPGIVGNVPDLTKANVEMQYDYRLVYGNIMKDWLLVPDDKLNEIFPGLMSASGTSDGVQFQALPIASQVITGIDDFIGSRFSLDDCFPNPAKNTTTIKFKINNAGHVSITLFDHHGIKADVLTDKEYTAGYHTLEVQR
jgi:hypothetical protein